MLPTIHELTQKSNTVTTILLRDSYSCTTASLPGAHKAFLDFLLGEDTLEGWGPSGTPFFASSAGTMTQYYHQLQPVSPNVYER